MRIATIVIAAMLAGCASAPTEDPAENGLPETPVDVEPLVLIESSAAWPTTPDGPVSIPFEVPNGTKELEVRFNWRGQNPGGFSSSRDALVIAPDGQERSFMGPDLPANPYVCASPTCGPADDRVEWFEDPAQGTWRIELRGMYTATAFFYAAAHMPAGNATGAS